MVKSELKKKSRAEVNFKLICPFNELPIESQKLLNNLKSLGGVANKHESCSKEVIYRMYQLIAPVLPLSPTSQYAAEFINHTKDMLEATESFYTSRYRDSSILAVYSKSLLTILKNGFTCTNALVDISCLGRIDNFIYKQATKNNPYAAFLNEMLKGFGAGFNGESEKPTIDSTTETVELVKSDKNIPDEVKLQMCSILYLMSRNSLPESMDVEYCKLSLNEWKTCAPALQQIGLDHFRSVKFATEVNEDVRKAFSMAEKYLRKAIKHAYNDSMLVRDSFGILALIYMFLGDRSLSLLYAKQCQYAEQRMPFEIEKTHIEDLDFPCHDMYKWKFGKMVLTVICDECHESNSTKNCPCKSAYYCSKNCREQHWSKVHKDTCSVKKEKSH